MGRKGFPRSHKARVLEGFVFIKAATCRECGGSVMWYRTPNKSRMPVDFVKQIPHFWCCPDRKPKAADADRREELQLELFPW